MTTATPHTVPAQDLREGLFLPGLDNGYIVEVEHDPTYGYGPHNTALPEGTVVVTFHTAEGDEATLILPRDVPVTVRDA